MKIVPIEFDPKGLTPSERETLQAILSDIAGVARNIMRAANKWCSLTDRTKQKVMDSVPPMWRTLLQRLQRVGENSLHPSLFLATGYGAAKLARLPLELQDQYLRELIPVALPDGDHRRKAVEDMSSLEQQQVFQKLRGGEVRIRTLEEQIAWLEARQRRLESAEERSLGNMTIINRPGRWKVEKGRAYIEPSKAKVGLTKRDLQLLLKDLSLED